MSTTKKNESINNQHITELNNEIRELKQEIHTHNTASRLFWNGVVSGLGRTIGATIVFGLMITLISYGVRHSDAGWIEMVIGWVGLDSYVQ